MKTTTKTFFASILLIGALLFTASCDKVKLPADDPDNFVKLSISAERILKLSNMPYVTP